MSQPHAANLDELLDRLEASIALLSEPGVSLGRLVAAHEEAVRVAEAASQRLAELEAWAGATVSELASTAPRE